MSASSSLKKQASLAEVFFRHDDQRGADKINVEEALAHSTKRVCACGLLATYGVGRVWQDKRNPEGVKR
jgi:hypothetical protein